MTDRYPRVASLRTANALREHLATLGLPLPCDEGVRPAADSPLAAPLALGDGPQGPIEAPNRFVIQPMEGWDATPDGKPSELTRRRWQNFGRSGAGWIWGGEAVAVRPDGRANPNQLVMSDATVESLSDLRELLLVTARETAQPEPVVGLQLTHSGRWSRPEGSSRPRIAYRHPLLDRRAGVTDDASVLSDEALGALIEDYARAARLTQDAGYAFVDLKHCHGYLLHELLSARSRTGRFGGEALEARLAFTRELVEAVRAAAPALRIGVRLSLFDHLPHVPGQDGRGEPEPWSGSYPFGFGLDPEEPARMDLSEPIAFARFLEGLGVSWVNVTAASPYYAPHLQRPALFPPSDGYAPPEDPLSGVARLLCAARDLKRAVPGLTVVSSGWTYLQEFLPHVAQACVREGWFDAVGLGRMALSYPDLPADVLQGKELSRKRICRTFSDCTTAPRNGLVSGCYPLDAFYRDRPERKTLDSIKQEMS